MYSLVSLMTGTSVAFSIGVETPFPSRDFGVTVPVSCCKGVCFVLSRSSNDLSMLFLFRTPRPRLKLLALGSAKQKTVFECSEFAQQKHSRMQPR